MAEYVVKKILQVTIHTIYFYSNFSNIKNYKWNARRLQQVHGGYNFVFLK